MDFKIGDRIISLRKEMNMSQEALAERVGVSRQAISKWERGEATPDIYNITALAEIFGLSIDEFIYKEELNLKQDKPKIMTLELKKKAEKLIMIAVAIFVVSAFGFLVLPFREEVNILVFGLMITSGILIVMKSSFMFEKFNMYNKEYIKQEEVVEKGIYKKKKEAIGTVVAILCTIIYLYISFVHGLWHPGWLVFLLIPVMYALFDVFEK